MIHKIKPINFPSIALVSNFTNILDRIVFNRSYDFPTCHNISDEYQFGFRKDAMSYLNEYIYQRLDQSLSIITVSLKKLET